MYIKTIKRTTCKIILSASEIIKESILVYRKVAYIRDSSLTSDNLTTHDIGKTVESEVVCKLRCMRIRD